MENVNTLDIDGTQWEVTDSKARQDVADLKTDSDEKIKEINAKLDGKADKNASLNSLEIINGYGTVQIIPWADGVHYRGYDNKQEESYTDIITERGKARIVKVENGTTKKIEEIATMDKVADVIKPLIATIPTSDFTNSMDMASRVTIPDGYKFLCWVYTTTNAWVAKSPLYMNDPTSINGYPYTVEAGNLPTGNGELIKFVYLVIRQ